MPLYSRAGDSTFDTPFVPCPAGVYSAVCVDVIDDGMKLSPFKNKDGSDKMVHKISIVWQVPKLMENSQKRYSIRQWFTNSLFSGQGKKSNLRACLDSWGVILSAEQNLGIEDFDLESLLGRPCLLNVVHAKSPDGTKAYANVGSIMPLPDGMAALSPENYVRKNAKAAPAAAASDDLHNPNFDDDKDIPF